MHEEIRHYVHENRALQKRLDSVESTAPLARHHSGAASSENMNASQSMLGAFLFISHLCLHVYFSQAWI